MVAYPTHEVDQTPEFEHYGPEPYSDEFTPEYLKDAFARRSAKVELVLMDQRVIAGIVNRQSGRSGGLGPARGVR